MASVKRNIIANYVGSGWSALMGLAFIPLYIKYLGIEAYGLIGLFTVLQSWLVLLEMGLAPTLSRELARFQAGARTPQSIHDLVRSVEWVYLAIAVAIACSALFGASWLATHWLRAEQLSTTTVANALAIIGSVIALRSFASLYRGAMIGLQDQVWLSGCTAIFATLRGLGAVAVLAWVSPTITSFFVYQGVVTALEVPVLALRMRRLLPVPPQRSRFRWRALHEVRRFAIGIATITLLAILLRHVDKLLLSRLLPLSQFGYYVLASSVAGALYLLVGPISNAAYPRLSELVAQGKASALVEAYHKLAQLLTLMIVPAALVLSLFPSHILLLWTRDSVTTDAVSPLVSLLVMGTVLNGLMHGPYILQLAYGWTRFSAIVNGIAVLVLIPGIYVGVSLYGAVGAAVMWVVLNVGYIGIAVPFVHRKLLPKEMWRWYAQDVFAPALASLAAVAIVRCLVPAPQLDHPLESVVTLCVASVVAVAGAVLTTPLGRHQFRSMIH